NNAGLAILPLDAAKLRRFYETAEYFRVAERDGNLAGFLVGYGSDSAHDSSNFAWFQQRYPSFFYIDRIVVASRRRGGGVGRAFYADAQGYAELRYPQMACEVFLDPGADAALLVRGVFGFGGVGPEPTHNARGDGGVGRAFYADAQSYGELRYPQMACEVFLDHGADAAVLFHGSFGFREVGQNTMHSAQGEVDVRASMLLKDLCSYEWVKETY